MRPIQVPTHPGPDSRFAWLNYEGRWGQKEASFNNGPTGPSTKRAGRTVRLDERDPHHQPDPAGRLGARADRDQRLLRHGRRRHRFLNASQRTPWILWAFPAAPRAADRADRLAHPLAAGRHRASCGAPRAFGQIVVTAGRLYGRHWRAFAPIGLSAIPIVGGLTALSWLLTGGDTGRSLDDKAGVSGLHVALGEVHRRVGLPVASARRLGGRDRRRRPGRRERQTELRRRLPRHVAALPPRRRRPAAGDAGAAR